MSEKSKRGTYKSTGLLVSILLAIFICLAGMNSVFGADKKIVLKAADVHPMDYPTVQGLVRIGDLLDEWTEGRITVQIYPSMQLGAEKEMLEQTQFGAIDILRVSIGPLGQIVPEFNVYSLPYIFRDADHETKVLDGPIGQELLKKAEKGGLIGLGYYDSGARSFYNTRKPVRSLADMKGMKFRVMGNDVFIDMMSALGASATPMAYGEVYTSLATGVIDGAENNFPSYTTSGHYEKAKYYTMDEHLRVPEIIVLSKKTAEKLSKADVALIRYAAEKSIPYQRMLWAEKEKESFEKAKAAGCQIITDIDKQPFINAMKPVYSKYASQLQDLITRIQAVK
jgi:tripartite ATP-independent transporter DctP family solute receptor